MARGAALVALLLLAGGESTAVPAGHGGGDSCAAGLVCAGAGGVSTCVQLCDRVCGEPCGTGTRRNTHLGESGEWGCGPLPATGDLLAQNCAGAGEACSLLAPATGTTGCMLEGGVGAALPDLEPVGYCR